ncbi:hypothetical protein IWQ62_000592 [Dispira parvispora]|uniref:RRM domain-containing protein n=1 Tax=Dispira parvispora TaxID=1520584 RepID=A0A9W8AUG5_9FUNG|nr:hypothetical protein IWQ62_000592 [Dispira parvispora]
MDLSPALLKLSVDATAVRVSGRPSPKFSVIQQVPYPSPESQAPETSAAKDDPSENDEPDTPTGKSAGREEGTACFSAPLERPLETGLSLWVPRSTRLLLITYLPNNLDLTTLQSMLGCYGEVALMCNHVPPSALTGSQTILTAFYDITHATQAVQGLEHSSSYDLQVKIHYVSSRVARSYCQAQCDFTTLAQDTWIIESPLDKSHLESIFGTKATIEHMPHFNPSQYNVQFNDCRWSRHFIFKFAQYLEDHDASQAHVIICTREECNWYSLYSKLPPDTGSYPMPSASPLFRFGALPSYVEMAALGNELTLRVGKNHVNYLRVISGDDKRTTFMLRNIPNKYTQKMLLDLINKTHFGQFDFFYLRMDFANHCNCGYAFINFTDPRSVVTLADRLVGKKWERFNSDKVCAIRYADNQGKASLIERFRNSK